MLFLASVSQGIEVNTGSNPVPDMAAFILTYGSYSNLQTESETHLDSGLTYTGLTSQQILHQGKHIDAKLGTAIGVEFGLIHSTTNANQLLSFITTPPKSILKPDTEELFDQITFTKTIKQTARNPFIGFLFDEEWECIPGTWTFQVQSGDKVILEKQLLVNFGK